MANGIGLDVVKYAGAEENLFGFKWYDPWKHVQQLKCYTRLWSKYYKKTKSMYIPFKYEGIYQIVHSAELKI